MAMLIHWDVEKGPQMPLTPSARQNSSMNLNTAYAAQ